MRTSTACRTFYSAPRSQDIDLYHKPMARNVQLWTDEYHAILDGPVGIGGRYPPCRGNGGRGWDVRLSLPFSRDECRPP